MSLQSPRFSRFTIDMHVRGIAFVCGESEQMALHGKIDAAIRLALLNHAQDHRVSIGEPTIRTSWNVEEQPACNK